MANGRAKRAAGAAGDVAVIGMACRFPGADGYDAFWDLLAARRSAVREIPPDRWDWRAFWGDPEAERNRCNSRWGGFIEHVDAFDAPFFSLSAREAELLDPQQRIMLELAWACFEDAGLRPSALSGAPVGVYVGSAILDYKELIEREGLFEAQYATGVAHSVISSRISHWFNLSGPSMPLDAACASSLYALHLAVKAIQRGECTQALAGGINVLLTPHRYISFAKMGILSPSGACRSFDDAADGTVRGEGAGLVLLKPLARALADGDPIHGVIKGSALNHGGKTRTLSYPNPDAQAAVLRAAWADARVEPDTISYLEAHGTGTPKGDPLEFEGLRRAFAGVSPPGRGRAEARCGVGTVKPNIGHLESAAGIAGVIKVLLSMQRGQLPPLQNFERLNHRIDLAGTPFHLVDRLEAWTRPTGAGGAPVPLRAGVSSFGFAGTNAHVVLEEAPARGTARRTAAAAGAEALICVTARTPEALGRTCDGLRAWIERRPGVDVGELGGALLATRERFAHRIALVAEGPAELARALGEAAAGGTPEGAVRGTVRDAPAPELDARARALVASPGGATGREGLAELAELFVSGAEIDGDALPGGPARRDLRLPGYPFARERHWLPSGRGAPRAGAGAVPWLHPLVHENASDLGAQRFRSGFDGTEPFLADHRIRGVATLPAAALVEMARAACALSAPGREIARLEDVVFVRPFTVGEGPRRAEVTVSPATGDRLSFEISSAGPAGEAPAVSCRGHASLRGDGEPGAERLDLEALRARCAGDALDGPAAYDLLARLGFDYGATHRGLSAVHARVGELLARVTPPPGGQQPGVLLRPGLLDAALQGALLVVARARGADGGEGAGPIPVPHAMAALEILGRCEGPLWVSVRAAPREEPDGAWRFDLDVCDDGGAVQVRVRRLEVQWLDAPTDAPAEITSGTLLAVPAWEALDGPAPDDGAVATRLVLLCEPAASLAEAVAAQLGGARVVTVRAGEGGVAERFIAAAAATLGELRALLQGGARGGALVQLVYAEAGDEALLRGLGGLLRSAALENPAVVAQAISLERIEDPALVTRALDACARWPRVRELRWRDERPYAARWRACAPDGDAPTPWKDGGVYLVTGGVGGLGLLLAEDIARAARGPTVYLAGRSEPTPGQAERVAALRAAGARVEHVRADVARRDAVDALVARIRADAGRLDGVIHAAGVLRDGFILGKTEADLREVLAAKVHGVVNLDEATRDLPLDLFVAFSSVAGVLGNAGQADYAAANAFLDTFCAQRAARVAAGLRHGRSLSVDWPLWRAGGMRVPAAMERALRERIGMRAVEASAALAALRRALAQGAPQVLFMEGDVERIQRALHEAERAAPAAGRPAAAGPAGAISLERAHGLLRRELSAALKVDPARMDLDAPMESHGIDSIVVVELTRRLERTLGPLPRTLFFEHRTLRALAQHLAEAHAPRLAAAAGPDAPAVAPRAEAPPAPPALRFLPPARAPEDPRPALAAAPIAIVGLAGRYPGARTIAEFWRNLRAGTDSITEIPPERWDHARYYDPVRGRPGKTSSRWGGFIDGVDEFDPLFFNISPREAEGMDPQERLFLQCAYEAIQDAGYTRETLGGAGGAPGTRVGVFVGVMWEEYPLHAAQEQARGHAVTVTGSPASIANRVSYFCDFTGPSLAVDTLCSSSLTALHLACESLHRGECVAAVAGGVNLSIHPNKYLALSAGGYVSSKGRCESFGEGGDGYVPGEGVGAVVLKPLARALADGDHVYGLIRGTAVNHGGKTNGFTVPSPVAQAEVIGAALARAGVDARAVSYVEAHGTGTSLGDPIEIAGLARAFARGGAAGAPACAIGSAKSNIGHCESAAGIAGLTKVLLQLAHRELVPSLHAQRLNPHIDFEGTPFRVQRELAPWARPVVGEGASRRELPRVAGLSSFGAGGSNAHVIVEELEAPPAASPPDGAPALLVLSARDEDRLRAAAGELAAWLRARAPSPAELADVAFTLQLGREAMEERLAVVASSAADATAKLEAFLAGETAGPGVLRGRAGAGGRSVSSLAADDDMVRVVASWMEKGKYDRLLALWVDGFRLDWAGLHQDRTPRRVSLPTYPFARERYWLPRRAAGVAHAAQGRAVLHPLVHENTSDLAGQRYSSRFTGEEPFLRDHVVRGRRILPAAAQLELACAAVRAATGGPRPGTVLRLEELRWSTPLAVGEAPVTVDVELAEAGDGKVSFELRSGEEGAVLHARGTAAVEDATPPAPSDLEPLRARCAARELAAAPCYAAFAAAGLAYGPAHQAIRRILVGPDEALAELAIPEAAAREGHGFGLHPSLVDGALQAAIGLLATEAPGGAALAVPTLLPAAVRAVEVLGSTSAVMWAHVRRRAGGSIPPGAVGCDLDLLDGAGRACARFAELVLVPPPVEAPARSEATRAAAEDDRMEAALLVPVWDAVTPPPAPSGAPAPGRTLLVGAGELLRALKARRPGAHAVDLGAGEGAALAGRLAALGPLDAVVWCAPPSQARGGAALLDAQELGTLHLFRVLRALLAAGHGERPLDLTLATCGAVQAGDDAAIEPAHAGVHGLAGAVAQEHPRWRVRLIDLDPGADAEAAADALARAPEDPAGLAWAVRGGEWLRQRLVPLARTPGGPSPYEDGAAYVVVGGAGGVGEVWTEHVLRAHAAQVVWIGRRPLDGAIRAKITRLAALGPAPRYVQADASDPESLRAAYQEIKRAFPRIRGVVHSAIVLRDQTLARMDEATFRAAYAAKVDVAVRMAEVFADEPLAFALFFSSTQALRGSPGQCNYAAACALEDAFALHLGRVLPCPVKVMDWGWWGEVGVVAGEAYRARMARAGIGSIQAAEGMEALDALLRAPFPRAAFIKTTGRARLEGTAADEELALAPPAPPVVAGVELAAAARAARPVAERAPADVAEEDALLAPLLAAQLERAGVAWRAAGPAPAPAGAPPHLRLWLAESVRLLAECRPEPERVGEAWARWDAYRASRPARRARLELAETMLRAVPDLLAGKRPATEVMFPGGGFGLVDGVYRGDPVADAFNAATAEAAAACVEARLREDPGARLRILEVGAGTGGTTGAILARLDPLATHLDEYCYSDISRAFLGRAALERAGGRAHVVGRVFDVDAAPAAQGLVPGSYDVVVAANVLHATADVRRSLRNVKATLRRNGVLVLNELCQASLFGHVTFGLLEGWWRPQDAALRIPGCPALSPGGWRRALQGEGFGDVRFPAEEAHAAGQQIVVAASDGVIRQPARDGARAGSRSAAAVAPAAVAGAGAIVATAAVAETRAAAPGGGPAPGLEGLRARALDHVRRVVGGLLKVAPERLDPTEPLGRYGIDSLLVMQITSALQGPFGPLGSTLLFEQQTLSALVEELLRTRRDAVARLPPSAGEEAAGGGATPPPAADVADAAPSAAPRAGEGARHRRRGRHVPAAEQGRARAEAPIAVVGIAGRYPKAGDIRAFWRNLRDGRHCVAEIPPDRWDWRTHFGEERGAFGTVYTRWGGFIDDVARFDAAFFRVSPREAAQMDPQERQFLETAYASIEDAGYTPGSLSPTRRVGVFAGVMNANYGTGAAHWSVANRVSFALDLRGPSLAVDTACSSSLTAIHLAAESLRAGSCECAIAGGVNLILDPLHLMKLSAASMLSPGDRCRAFGAGADGIVDAEGVGAVVLKPLARAIADHDHVYGVIRGSTLNAGGRTHGYTVPNPLAQEEVIAEALRRAGVSPRSVSYVEAHGTGTELGDPIEIAGLTRAFGRGTTARQFCALGSVKSNIGHAESAAGIAALTKVLLQLEHRQLAPSLHADAENPRLELPASPFTIQRALSEWRRPVVEVDGAPREVPRVAGISSFGAGGANVHLVVEEPPAEAAAAGDAGPRPVAVVLSARTERELRERARQLVGAIDDGEVTDARLADVAFTLQVGREALPERLGLVAASVEELRRGLAAFVDGEVPAGGLRGRAEARDDAAGVGPEDDVLQGAMATWTARGQLEKVLKLWIAGLGVDWRRLYDDRRRPRRVSLPTYPFAGERHWTPIRRAGADGVAGAQPAAAAPAARRPEPQAPPSPVAAPSPHATPPAQASRAPVRLEPAAAGIPLPARAAGPRPSAPAAPPRVTLRPIEGPDAGAGIRAPAAQAAATSGAALTAPPPAVERPATPPPAARAAVSAAALRAELAESLARALYMQAGEVDPDRNFVDMGLDSVVGVEWIKAVNKQYGTALKATVVYDHPTVRAFAAFLEAELARAGSRGASPREAPAPVQAAPRRAPSLRELLRQVQEGEVTVEDASRRFQELQDPGAQVNDG